MSVPRAVAARRTWRSPLSSRALDLGPLLDTLMICAIATILVIRTQLWLTNYPQLGGNGLHIAHLLWGGLGMLIAIVILVSFLNPIARRVGAVVGGIGFGFFIDELGKFLTADNNYFFKPTAAIIYIFFIAFYLVARALQHRHRPTEQEYVANALELAQDAAAGGMTARERERALGFLAEVDPANPVAAPLRALLLAAPSRANDRPWLGERLVRSLRRQYAELAGNRWFARVVTAVFVVWAISTISAVIALITTLEPHLATRRSLTFGGALSAKNGDYSFVEWANVGFSLVAGLFVAWGVLRLRRSRPEAYELFERGLLVSLFFTQVFVFIQSQFGACLGFLVDVLLLVTVRFMQERERDLEGGDGALERPESGVAPPLPA